MSEDGAANQFWTALNELYEAAGRPPLSRLVKLGKEQEPPIKISDATVNDWLLGKVVPSAQSARYFTALVGFLKSRAATHSDYQPRPEAGWLQLLKQAQDERGRNRGGRPPAPKGPPPSVSASKAPPPSVSGGTPQVPTPRPWRVVLVAVVVVGALLDLLLQITGVGSEANDSAAGEDAAHDVAQAGGDIRYTVTYLDDGYDLVLPEGVELTTEQKRYLSNWSLDYQDPHGYGLDTLVKELRTVGGANPQKLRLRITLEGRRNQPIRVDDIRPVNIRRRAPLDGTFLFIPPQEPGQTIKMMFDFDEVEPRPRTAVDQGGTHTPGELFFQDKTLTITDGEEDALVIESVTTRRAVTFDIGIDYRIDGKPMHLVIDNNGHPFALTPMSCTDRTPLAEDGSMGDVLGHASYRDIWAMRDSQRIEPVTDPGHFTIGYPYC